jgi:DNA helicase II / ATP-dependent DNA helicase PcrA
MQQLFSIIARFNSHCVESEFARFRCYNLPMIQNNLLSGLNPPQKEAVEAVNGPVLILAGPGSGKTRVITHRIAYLIKDIGIAPDKILAVTFTNKAAKEMASRLEKLVPGSVHKLTLGTFHAICAGILRREGEQLGAGNNFTIYDADDQIKLVKEALKLLDIDSKNFSPGNLASHISTAKSQMLSAEELATRSGSYFEEILVKVYRQYQQLLEHNNALDFDDLLFKTVRGLKDNPRILEKYQKRISYLLVDEFQDTNLVQYELIKLIGALHRNICVVGDPDQSIYSWRAADIRNILNFEKDYPYARTILLEQNYRSTANILQVAQSIICNNQSRKAKDLWTENKTGDKLHIIQAYDQQEEARILVGEIDKLVGKKETKLGDIAVLYRTNAQSRALEEALVRYGIPYRLASGTRFYERREVKDIIAYLKLIHNPDDSLSLARIINVPPRGIGKQTIEELRHETFSHNCSEGELLSSLTDAEPDTVMHLSLRSFKLLQAFGFLFAEFLKEKQILRMPELLDYIIERISYQSFLQSQPDGEDRWQNVLELRSVAQQYSDLSPDEGLSAFLEGVSLVSDTDALSETPDCITLITLHQAKGLEFPVVFITGLEEGILPHYRAMDDPAQMEEERRLCYVGITRAQKKVYLLRAFKRMLMGSTQMNPPSRFLRDIPGTLVEGNAPPKLKPLFINPGVKLPEEKTNNTRRAEALPQIAGNKQKTGVSVTTDITGIKVGKKVRHPQFGDGIVVSVKPANNDYEVIVAFDGEKVNIKRLLLSFARLELV